MPIRPENRDRYPPNWLEIRARILKRAENGHGWPCCEACGVPNYAYGYRDTDGTFHDMGTRGMAEWAPDGSKIIKIILTIAHLNHTPEDVRDENLKALCQRCHNRHDAKTRRMGIVERARAVLALGDLFK